PRLDDLAHDPGVQRVELPRPVEPDHPDPTLDRDVDELVLPLRRGRRLVHGSQLLSALTSPPDPVPCEGRGSRYAVKPRRPAPFPPREGGEGVRSVYLCRLSTTRTALPSLRGTLRGACRLTIVCSPRALFRWLATRRWRPLSSGCSGSKAPSRRPTAS